MTKRLDVYIGEMHPWPDTVNVVRCKTDEVRRFVPEELGTRALLDGAELMGENRRLRESNDKLRELFERFADSFEKDAAMNNGNGPYCIGEDWLALANDMRIELAEACGELGIEVDR